MNEIAHKIKDLRTSLGLSQREFYERYKERSSGRYDQKYISAVEVGRYEPTDAFIRCVEEEFDVSLVDRNYSIGKLRITTRLTDITKPIYDDDEIVFEDNDLIINVKITRKDGKGKSNN